MACSNSRETSVARLEGAKERETEAETRKGAGAEYLPLESFLIISPHPRLSPAAMLRNSIGSES